MDQYKLAEHIRAIEFIARVIKNENDIRNELAEMLSGADNYEVKTYFR